MRAGRHTHQVLGGSYWLMQAHRLIEEGVLIGFIRVDWEMESQSATRRILPGFTPGNHQVRLRRRTLQGLEALLAAAPCYLYWISYL